MRTLIVIPARYGSTRLPGKPLIPIAGRALVSRVADIARTACAQDTDTAFVIATDDARIEAHCRAEGLPVVMTDPELPSGSDRALAAARAVASPADIIVNLQGDAPFTPPAHVRAVITACATPGVDAATPVVRLSWEALDALRAHKAVASASGTTAIVSPQGDALWFSKSILPQMRKEAALRAASPLSPVLRHIGLYAYRREALEAFCAAPESHYERIEGLEQLRLLEMGRRIRAVEVEAPEISMAGIDQPEDVTLAEQLLAGMGNRA